MKLSKKEISSIKRNDRMVIRNLYQACYGLMIGISLRYQSDKSDAEIIVNDAFLKVIKSIDKYDPESSILTWISRITINTCIDAYRKKNRLRQVISGQDIDTVPPDISKVQYNQAMEELDAEYLRRLIASLPSTTAKVFNLYAIDGYKHREIGEMLGISEGTSKWHLNNARKRLKMMLENKRESEKIELYGK